ALDAGVRAALALERLAELALDLGQIGLVGRVGRRVLLPDVVRRGLARGRLGSRLLDGHTDLLRRESTYPASHIRVGFIEPPPGWGGARPGHGRETTDNDGYGATEGTGRGAGQPGRARPGRALAGRRPAGGVDAAGRRGTAVARGPGRPRVPGLRVRQ